ncbi:PKD domain-containing protein, partial [bacterium]|nr:PKD domain-containing protein [bacterium]
DVEVCANAEVRFDGTNSKDFDGLVNRYFWDFGDGHNKDGATPTHVYREPGEYLVTLTITGDQVGECDNTDTDDLVVKVYDAPVAKFIAPHASPLGSKVSFDASESTSGGGKIVQYAWDFGDGSTGEGKTITHVYDKPGKFFVNLNIRTDSETECNETETRSLIFINEAPLAKAGKDRLVGVNEVVLFNGAESKDEDGSVSRFQWDFGDGNTGEGLQTRHKYKHPGVYTVRLIVFDDTELANNAARDSLRVTVNAAPEPALDTPEWVCAGEAYTFSGAGSKDADGTIGTYRWEFGDGGNGQGAEVQHTYKTPGTYNVTLLVDDGRGVSNSRVETSRTIRVNNPPVPVAHAPRLVCPGTEVTFDGSGSYDKDGEITRHIWDFGDGTRTEGARLKHAFEKPGLYRVRLTVEDNANTSCGRQSTQTEIRVNAPPVADAGEDKTGYAGGAHDAVQFSAAGSSDPDGDPLTYEWSFGDGTTLYGRDVSHPYSRTGTYTVTLKVSDGTGLPCGTSTDQMTVTIETRSTAAR